MKNTTDDELFAKLLGLLDPLSDGQVTAEGSSAYTRVSKILHDRGTRWTDVFERAANTVSASDHQTTLDTLAEFKAANDALKKNNAALIGENGRLRWRHSICVKVGALIGPKIAALGSAISKTAFWLTFPLSFAIPKIRIKRFGSRYDDWTSDSNPCVFGRHIGGTALWAGIMTAAFFTLGPPIQSAYSNYVLETVEKPALVQALKEGVPAGSQYPFVTYGPLHEQLPLTMDYKPDPQKTIYMNGQVSPDVSYRVDITAPDSSLGRRSNDRVSLPANPQLHH